MNVLADIISFLADFTALVASSIAIYIFFFKRKYLKTVFDVLVNYSSQITLSELDDKLDKLNNLRVLDDYDEIINIFSEVIGQLNGNPKLSGLFKEITERLNEVIDSKSKSKRISEPWKRAMVSEIRERIRHVGILNIQDISGDS